MHNAFATSCSVIVVLHVSLWENGFEYFALHCIPHATDNSHVTSLFAHAPVLLQGSAGSVDGTGETLWLQHSHAVLRGSSQHCHCVLLHCRVPVL